MIGAAQEVRMEAEAGSVAGAEADLQVLIQVRVPDIQVMMMMMIVMMMMVKMMVLIIVMIIVVMLMMMIVIMIVMIRSSGKSGNCLT